MLGFNFIKAAPTTHLMHYQGGKLTRQGLGLSFFYLEANSTIVLVPAGSMDAPFLFEEVTADFQSVTIQGELTFSIREPEVLAKQLDYSVDRHRRYNSDDPPKLNDRLIRAAQIQARSFTQEKKLAELLVSSDSLIAHILGRVRDEPSATMLGVDIIGLSITSIKATPEMTKALQADAREALLRQADEAVAERRNAAVEAERRIKENELQTEIAVELKRREVSETKMQADIALELKRAELVEQRVANERKEAQAKGEALDALIKPIKEVDWRQLVAAFGGMNAEQMIAMAFRDLADNAEKIGNLNISPELLEALLARSPEKQKRREK